MQLDAALISPRPFKVPFIRPSVRSLKLYFRLNSPTFLLLPQLCSELSASQGYLRGSGAGGPVRSHGGSTQAQACPHGRATGQAAQEERGESAQVLPEFARQQGKTAVKSIKGKHRWQIILTTIYPGLSGACYN